MLAKVTTGALELIAAETAYEANIELIKQLILHVDNNQPPTLHSSTLRLSKLHWIPCCCPSALQTCPQ